MATSLARLSLLKSALLLNDSGSSNDDVYKLLLKQASLLAAKHCHRTLESTAYTDEFYWGNNRRDLWLRQYPVTALTTVKMWDGTDSYDTLTSSLYELRDQRTVIFPAPGQESGAQFSCWPSSREVKISYTAGYDTTGWATAVITASFGVPEDLELAVARLAAYLWIKAVSTGVQSESMGPRSITWADALGRFGMGGAVSPLGIPVEVAAELTPYMLLECP